MFRRTIVMALGLALSIPALAEAQRTIGTTKSAPTTLVDAGSDNGFIGQTFRPTGTDLLSITFWLHGIGTDDQIDAPGYNFATSWLHFGRVGGWTEYDYATISQTNQGRYTARLSGITVEAGEEYFFGIESNTGGGLWNPGQIRPDPMVERTTGDAYLDGYAFRGLPGRGGPSPTDGDLRFRVVSTVPEPSTVLLMITGMIGLGVIARRRRVGPAL